MESELKQFSIAFRADEKTFLAWRRMSLTDKRLMLETIRNLVLKLPERKERLTIELNVKHDTKKYKNTLEQEVNKKRILKNILSQIEQLNDDKRKQFLQKLVFELERIV